jgi:hypothetical protein
MSSSLPEPIDAARSRFRAMVTTILLILISVMIVRDIFVRRWSAAAPPSRDVTSIPGEGLHAQAKSP